MSVLAANRLRPFCRSLLTAHYVVNFLASENSALPSSKIPLILVVETKIFEVLEWSSREVMKQQYSRIRNHSPVFLLFYYIG